MAFLKPNGRRNLYVYFIQRKCRINKHQYKVCRRRRFYGQWFHFGNVASPGRESPLAAQDPTFWPTERSVISSSSAFGGPSDGFAAVRLRGWLHTAKIRDLE